MMDRGTNRQIDAGAVRSLVAEDGGAGPGRLSGAGVRSGMGRAGAAPGDSGLLSLLVKSSDDAVIGCALDGTVRVWNPAAERLLGYAASEIVGRSIARVIPPDRADEMTRVIDHLRRRERVGRFESVRLHKDGEAVPVSMTVSPIRDASGELVGTSVVARDITRREYAELSEREELARLRAVVDTAVDGILTLDEQGLIESVNAAAMRMFGHPAEELRGRSVRALMPGAACATRNGSGVGDLRGLTGAGPAIRGVRRDGTEFPIELSVSETRLWDRTIYTAIVRDVTARRQAERAARESEARYRLLTEAAPHMAWTLHADGTLEFVSGTWLELTGLTRADVLRDGWPALVHGEDRARVTGQVAEPLRQGQAFGVEFRAHRADGVERWMSLRSVPLRDEGGVLRLWIGTATDITDRKRAEEALRASEDRLRAKVQQRTAQLTAANARLAAEIEQRRRAEALLGFESRILELIAVGAPLDEVFGAVDGALRALIGDVRCAIRLARNGHSAEGGGQSSGTRAAEQGVVYGSMAGTGIAPALGCGRAWVEDVRVEAAEAEELEAYQAAGVRSYWCEPIRSAAGEAWGVLGVYCDRPRRPDEVDLEVSATLARLGAIAIARVAGEERARQQSVQLAHVARLATMGEMASGMAHELNQPLCAIVNFTEACVELMNAGTADADTLRGALGDVSRQAQRAGAVLRRLRDFVRRQEPQRQPVDLNALVREVAALTGAEARHAEATMKLRLAKRLPRALADAIQVQQVLVNLVRNSLDALGEVPRSRRGVTIRTAHRAGEVEVSVSDTGRGIAPEHRERLFEPFFTTKREGMGMGLSISRSIVELHEGRIWAPPRRRGCTVRFTLPIVVRRQT